MPKLQRLGEALVHAASREAAARLVDTHWPELVTRPRPHVMERPADRPDGDGLTPLGGRFGAWNCNVSNRGACGHLRKLPKLALEPLKVSQCIA